MSQVKTEGFQPQYGVEKTIRFLPEKPLVIICEGEDDVQFIRKYLEHLSTGNNIDVNKFNVVQVNGVTNLKNFIKNCNMYSDYGYMKSFLFIRDADNDVRAAISSLQDHIQRAWNVNLDSLGNFQSSNNDNGAKVGFFIMPGLNENNEYRNGRLEDLCLDILNLQEGSITCSDIIEEVDCHIKKVVEKRNKTFKHTHKNRLHLCFSSTDEFVGDKIGSAAKKKAFNFDSSKLTRLRAMILEMDSEK